MKKFSEWLEQKKLQEGSLGLKRRQRVATGLAKRAERIQQIYPNSSDSRGHEIKDQLDRDAQAAAGRFDRADQNMRDRSEDRIAAIARGDKAARQMQAGRGNVDKIRANVQASSDANRSLANYNRSQILAQRGKDPNWAAQSGNRSFTSMANTEIAQAARKASEAEAELTKDMQRFYGGNKLSSKDKRMEKEDPRIAAKSRDSALSRLINMGVSYR